MNNDHEILRDLAQQVKALSDKAVQEERRMLWREHNGLIKCGVPVFANIGGWDVFGSEVMPGDKLTCKDPLYRSVEFNLRHALFMDYIDNDTVIEPWYTVHPIYACHGWGIDIKRVQPEGRSTYHLEPVITDIKDVTKLKIPSHAIDENQTSINIERISDAIGDILPVISSRSPCYTGFTGDISYWLGQFVGFEELLYHVYDNPELLHELLKFLRDGIQKTYKEAELAGDWTSMASQCQSPCYVKDLPDPTSDGQSMPMNKIWGYYAAQEYDTISPQMHKEFLLDYQMPLMKQFGLIAYGCCEDLTNKIDMLREVPNLRRIAVSPFANAEKCAKQIERDYVISYRPNPAALAVSNWNAKEAAALLKYDIDAMKDSIYDICIKDVTTVCNEPHRLKEWISAVKDLVD